MDIELEANQKKALRRAVRNGDYHLLLGAGASRDAVSASGSTLPTGPELATLMASKFDVPIEEGDLLWRIYARAVEDAGEEEVYDWLRSIFWEVTPPTWMDVYARTPWSTVWTLNIDDVFERAYARVQSDESRSLITVNWDDEFRQSRHLSVVHLHGCVDRDTMRRRLVFSLSEYSGSSMSSAAWPLNFRDTYGILPFVIIGARLRDEPDIEAVIANRTPSHEAPSFYVSPNISQAVERDLRKWNLIPVRMTAEEFSDAWPELTSMNLREAPSSYEEVTFRVGRQFRELKLDAPNNPPRDHDFIGGDEPQWADIKNGLNAELDWIRKASDDCKQIGQSIRKNTAMVYVGKRLTGRTTGLFAIGKALRSLSWRTYLYVGDERPDIDAILQFAASGKSIALLFDSVAEIADDVASLLSLARSADLQVICIAVDQADRTANVLGRIDEVYLSRNRVTTINNRLTRTDAARLVDKLKSIGRLGILESEKKDSRRLAHFRGRELFDSMAELENAPAFGRRVSELVDAITDPDHVTVLLLAALASRFDRRFHASDASRMVGMESDFLVRLIRDSHPLSWVLKTDGIWINPRQRWMALEACVARLGSREALVTIGRAMQRVAPRLGRTSHRERNATALLVGSFMSYKNISSVFPNEDLDQWYETLSPTFGDWSARYWEQRAILNRNIGRSKPDVLAKAESFVLRAVSIVRDSYSLTTLGTVLLTKAAYGSAGDVEQYYDRAIDAFEGAGEENPNNLVTWDAFLRYALRVLAPDGTSLRPLDDDLLERLQDDWLRIHAQIVVAAGASEEVKTELANLKRRFQRITGR
ncbi:MULTISPECIES: SIR2 family protein [Nocardiopsis]|uniref:SIR2 family protein n=1 Tax=Nocardiopsis akebiae TaxID=2831968 RepID=A0ABX8C5J6_9ACTN|nr:MULTISPECIES: SIR2 family protein [Nocardiopsis]QUX29675.1 SIR2 family protein [Nocardiopsis akebiae]WDZ90394.1 SIR2 family protein [Nocardiopsis sp. HUAS JQ3]